MAKSQGNPEEGDEIKRGPKGGRKHKPGRDHVKEAAKRAAKEKAAKKKAARNKARQSTRDAIEKAWQELTEEQRKLLKGVPGTDPDV